MADEHAEAEKEDYTAPDVTLERLTDVLNEVLAIPAEDGLGLVVRAQVERAGAVPAEALERNGARDETDAASRAEAEERESHAEGSHRPGMAG